MTKPLSVLPASSRRLSVAVLLALSGVCGAGCSQAAAPSPSYIWWEAEKPADTNFPDPKQNPFAPANPTEASVLSGGEWIGVSGPREKPLYLEYSVKVPEKGQYYFYTRKFWKHGPFRWRFDNGAWNQVGSEIALMDSASLRPLLGANWVSLGTVKLSAGTHKLRLELTENDGAAAFDAFLLTKEPFTARGKLKPGEKYNRAPQGWFPFEPNPDPFKPSPIDLRSLNEKAAGDNGFIQVKNGEFVHGKTGKPVRFWAVNAGPDIARMDKASVDTLARFLAKKGVNMVRYHGTLYEGRGPNVGKVDPEMLDKIQYFVAAMKREGIYTAFSIYFPLWVRLHESPQFAGYEDKPPFDLIYFNEDFQKMYRGWWEALLTSKNPYSGQPLVNDPAVAFLELVNEESHFFWTFTPYQNLPEPQTILLEKKFGGWLKEKYGSLDAAFKAWGGTPIKGDEMEAGRAGFMPLWEIFNKKDQRAKDTAAFLAEDQRAFYQETYDYLKNDLGFKGSVYGSNWKTASAQVLEPIDKYTNTVADFLDRHGYMSNPHEGERAGYSISPGDRYNDKSALRFETGMADAPGPDFDLPIVDILYNNRPSTISEVNWTAPNRFRADMPLLSAAYGSLQGTDAFFFFALSGSNWMNTLSKWPLETPTTMGQFPATAYLYRKGLVKPGGPVVQVDLNVNDLMNLKGMPISAPQNLDELRQADIPAGRTAVVEGVESIDPRSFYVGKVAVDFTEKPGKLQIADLSKYINNETKTIRSVTDELTWDYDTGLMRLNAPQAQGFTGFFKAAGPLKADQLSLKSDMEYGAVTLVSLDGKPLSQSGKMLLQVMSEDKNYGWDAPGTGMREIKSVGDAPIVVKEFSGTVSLNRPDAANLKVTALDFNGYRGGTVGNGKTITLRPRTLYYLIEK